MFKQTLSLLRMLTMSFPGSLDSVDFYKIQDSISSLPQEVSQHFLTDDTAFKSDQQAIDEVFEIVSTNKAFTAQKNVSDELMNLVNVVCQVNEEVIGIQLLNQHCYLPPLIDDERMVKRTVELKHQILEDLF